MSDLVGNPEDRFSHDAAHIIFSSACLIYRRIFVSDGADYSYLIASKFHAKNQKGSKPRVYVDNESDYAITSQLTECKSGVQRLRKKVQFCRTQERLTAFPEKPTTPKADGKIIERLNQCQAGVKTLREKVDGCRTEVTTMSFDTTRRLKPTILTITFQTPSEENVTGKLDKCKAGVQRLRQEIDVCGMEATTTFQTQSDENVTGKLNKCKTGVQRLREKLDNCYKVPTLSKTYISTDAFAQPVSLPKDTTTEIITEKITRAKTLQTTQSPTLMTTICPVCTCPVNSNEPVDAELTTTAQDDNENSELNDNESQSERTKPKGKKPQNKNRKGKKNRKPKKKFPSKPVPKPTLRPSTKKPAYTITSRKHRLFTTVRPKPTIIKTREPRPTTESKPVTKKPRPTTEKPKPVTKKPRPTTEKPKPVTKKPRSTTEKPKPVTKKPRSTTEKPKTVTKKPRSTTEKPKRVTRRPTPPTTKKPRRKVFPDMTWSRGEFSKRRTLFCH